jgi:hypothetical protein
MTTNFDMIGREEVDDLEAILSITNSDVDEVVHTVRAEADALFTWDYERSRPALRRPTRGENLGFGRMGSHAE